MKQYAIGCVRDAYQLMVADWRTIFLQLENLKDHEYQLKQDKKRLMAAIKEGKILGKEDVMTLSIIPGLKESVIEWLEQTPGVSVTGGLENTVIAESSIAVWNELLRTKFWEWKENVKENVGIEPRTHRACETMSLPSGKIFSSIVQIEGTVDFPLTSFLKHPIRDVGL